MNRQTNETLEKYRQELKSQLSGSMDGQLSEAEVLFCEQGIAKLKALDYELEGFENAGAEVVADALRAAASNEGGNVAADIAEFLSSY